MKTVVMVTALIVTGCAFYAQQNTERREKCIENGGTSYDNKCLMLNRGQ